MASEPDETWTYDGVAESATEVRALLDRRGIRLHRESTLSRIFRQATALSDDWQNETQRTGYESARRLADAAYALRICTAIMEVSSDQAALEPLRRVAGNNVNLGTRNQSQGKDALWELELLAWLRRHGVHTELMEPPDLVVRLQGRHVGVACKKVYSERGAEAQVRSGCKQLARFGGWGVVALIIDNFIPAERILVTGSREAAADALQRLNREFLHRQQKKFERFMLQGRCQGILVSSSALAQLTDLRVNFNTVHEATVWTLQEFHPDVRHTLSELASALAGPRALHGADR